MILGIGIDMVKISKMERAVKRWGKSFIEKVFNEEELKSISPGKIYYQRLGARFAAKEAVIKAVSKNYSLGLKDILILNRDNGAPYCKLKKNIRIEIIISMSHIKDYAVATAIAQEKA